MTILQMRQKQSRNSGLTGVRMQPSIRSIRICLPVPATASVVLQENQRPQILTFCAAVGS